MNGDFISDKEMMNLEAAGEATAPDFIPDSDAERLFGTQKTSPKAVAQPMPEESPRWKVGEKEIKQPGELLTPGGLARTVIRPAVNLLWGMPAETVKKLISIPGEVKKTAEEGALGKVPESVFNLITSPLKVAGQTILGGVQAGIKEITGYELPDEESKKAFNNLKVAIKDAIKNPTESAGKLAESIYTITQENPEYVLLAADQINHALSKATGKNVDVVKSALRPLEQPVRDASVWVKAKAMGKLQTKAVKSLESRYNEIFKATKPATKALEKGQARGKDPAKFLADKKIVVDIEDGTIKPAKQIEILEGEVKQMEEVFRDVLKQDPELADLNVLRKNALTAVNNPINRSQNVVGKLQSAINKEVDGYIKTYGQKVPKDVIEDIKIGQRIQSKVFDQTKPAFYKNANYQLSNEARKFIERNTKGVEVQAFKDYMGNYYDAIDMLEKVAGNKIKGGRLGKYFAMGIGSTLGTNVFSKLGGAALGNWLVDVVQSNYLTNPFKNFILNKVKTTNPDMYNQALDFIRKQEGLRETYPKLPPPSYIPMGPITRPQGKTELIPAKKGPIGIEPKTKKFMKTYLSTGE